MNNIKLTGCGTALITPFKDGEVDYAAFAALTDRQVAAGIDFLVPLGTTLVNIGESEKKLNELIGLSGIKESIKKIKAYALANRDSENLNIHMCFLGNPGTGKTEVARYIAGILYENKILPTNKVVEVDRSGLVSQYFGATAEKTSRVIDRAMGGVLFVDEAYALGNKPFASFMDGLGNGLGYAMILVIVAFFRELLGSGTLFGFQVIPQAVYDFGYMNNGLMILPPMALILLGCIIWVQRSIQKDLQEK